MNWQDLSETITDACIDVFSESVEVHLFDKDTNSFEVVASKAIFDSEYKQIDLNTGAIVSSNAPMIELSSRALSRPLTKHDKIQARGVLYKVREIQVEASGAVKAILSRS